jgi:uncharacterized protein
MAGGGDRDADPAGGTLAFPCRFDIKAMGRAGPDFAARVTQIVARHTPEADMIATHARSSRDDNYLSVTLTITARSRDQLDAIYRELTACAEVLIAL